jgi:hypothetical protein
MLRMENGILFARGSYVPPFKKIIELKYKGSKSKGGKIVLLVMRESISNSYSLLNTSKCCPLFFRKEGSI